MPKRRWNPKTIENAVQYFSESTGRPVIDDEVVQLFDALEEIFRIVDSVQRREEQKAAPNQPPVAKPSPPVPMLPPQPMENRLLRRREVEQLTGLSRSTIYAYMERGLFPKPVKLGQRAIAWPASDVRRWIEERVGTQSG